MKLSILHSLTLATALFAASSPVNAATVPTTLSAGPAPSADTTFDGTASATDLVNFDQATLVSATTTRTPTFGFSGINNGVAATNGTDSAFYRNSELSSSVTFTLNTTLNPNGYDLQTVRSLAGWAGANITQANQQFELLTSQVGAASFTSHGTFDNSPFAAASNSGASTSTTLTDTTGTIASNVDVVRFNLFYPGFVGNNNNPGTVFRELDVEGVTTASLAPPAPVNLIQNGSFESPMVAGFKGFDTATPFDSNWAISPVGAAPDGEVTLVRGQFGTIASDGNQWLSLESFNSNPFPDNVGTISQNIATETGATYELSFDYNALGVCPRIGRLVSGRFSAGLFHFSRQGALVAPDFEQIVSQA